MSNAIEMVDGRAMFVGREPATCKKWNEPERWARTALSHEAC
jgi:hypothetical protein